MKRFAIVAALAVAFGLGTAGIADAQYLYQYNTITPNGGVVTSSSLYSLGAYQTYNTYVSPFGSMRERAYYTDVFGNTDGYSNGLNAWTGSSYNRGYYQPSPFLYPYGGGYQYNFYRRW